MPPTWQSEYQRIVAQARNQTLQSVGQEASERLARDYGRQIAQVLTLMDEVDLQGASASRAEILIRELRAAMRRYANQAEISIRQVIDRTTREGVEAHVQALERAQVLTGRSVEASFGGVPERAQRLMFTRRGLGLTGSYKTLTQASADASVRVVEEALSDALAGGATPQEATDRILRGMVAGDEELEEAVRQIGPRGGLRQGVDPGEVPQAVRDRVSKIGFDARRIALTETQTAYHESNRLSAARSPVVEALKWELSAAHPERDVCDLLATQDIYGLGAGLYPAEVLPPKPHPFCLCFTTHEFARPQDWGRIEVDVDEPRELSDTTARDLLGDEASGGFIRRQRQMLNQNVRNAYEVWQSQ